MTQAVAMEEAEESVKEEAGETTAQVIFRLLFTGQHPLTNARARAHTFSMSDTYTDTDTDTVTNTHIYINAHTCARAHAHTSTRARRHALRHACALKTQSTNDTIGCVI